MNEQIRLLQAEIQDDLQAIDQAYEALNSVSRRVAEPEGGIVVGYHLHVLYGLFESLFARIATMFGSQITDKTKWHAQLLRRMTLDVQGVRPHCIGNETYECLDELRRFRHLFRNAYVLHFDPDRLTIVLRNAERLERLYRPDIEEFLAFLDGMAGQELGC
jgi:hypothetical protein